MYMLCERNVCKGKKDKYYLHCAVTGLCLNALRYEMLLSDMKSEVSKFILDAIIPNVSCLVL